MVFVTNEGNILNNVTTELHGNPDGTIPATFQVIYMVIDTLHTIHFLVLIEYIQIGWKPSPNTPLPKKRGSATTSLKDVLEN